LFIVRVVQIYKFILWENWYGRFVDAEVGDKYINCHALKYQIDEEIPYTYKPLQFSLILRKLTNLSH
jgi:hypothetical protein